MLKKRKRVGLPKIKALLLATVLFVSCDGTVFHRFEQVDSTGWTLGDTLSFVYEGSALAPVGAGIEYALQVRYGADYRFKNLCMRVETWKDSLLLSADTLSCLLYDDRGRRLGNTAGTIYQNESETKALPVLCTDTIIMKVSHIMDIDSLQDVFDVGVRLSAMRR